MLSGIRSWGRRPRLERRGGRFESFIPDMKKNDVVRFVRKFTIGYITLGTNSTATVVKTPGRLSRSVKIRIDEPRMIVDIPKSELAILRRYR